MSQLEQNTTNLQLLLEAVNNLPEAIEIETVDLATPTISVSSSGLVTATVTQSNGGKVESGSSKSATKQLTTKGAQTITPSTAAQTIAANTYLSGAQTIKGDANLVASNIKSGVSIFGVDGTLDAEQRLNSLIAGGISGDYINTTTTYIKNYAFMSCTKLTSITFRAVTLIGGYAFYNCTGVTKVDLYAPSSLPAQSLGKCSSLTTLILRKSDGIVTAVTAAFSGTPFATGGSGGTVYVPSALISSYQTASGWSTLYNNGTCTFAAIEGSIYE